MKILNRLKAKRQVKKWKWLILDNSNMYYVTKDYFEHSYQAALKHINGTVVQKIEDSLIKEVV